MDTYSKQQSFPLLEIAKARSKDPQTSHAAADRCNRVRLVQSHHAKILGVLGNAVQGLTPREISLRCGLEYHAVQRRMKELEQKGKIGWDGIRDHQRVWGLI
jgi:hypothetical protein